MIELVSIEKLRKIAEWAAAREDGAYMAALSAARAVAERLSVEVVLELDLDEPYLCPLVEADRYGDSASDDECACYDAVDRHDMPTSCPRTIYGNEVPRGKPRFSAPENCPLRKGPVLVRAKP